jgi:hypothetical protein
MARKKKIIDIVLFGGDSSLLEFRIKELSEYVDEFLIIVSTTKSEVVSIFSNDKLKSSLDKPIKIFYTNVDFNSKNIEPNLKTLLERIILQCDLNFTDVVMVSKYNEIPDFSIFDKVYDELDFGPIFLKSVCVVWNSNYVERHKKFGTFIFQFTHLITKEVDLGTLLRDKSNIVIPKYGKINGGWILNGFETYTVFNKTLLDDRLPNESISPIRTYQLIERDPSISLPKHILDLKNKKIGREYTKTHFFDCDDNDDEKYELSKFDTLNKIIFTDNPIETFTISDNLKIRRFNSFLPTNVLYGNKNYSDFIFDYKMNEVKKFCSTIFPTDQDIIVIKINDKIFEYRWIEFKQKILFD